MLSQTQQLEQETFLFMKIFAPQMVVFVNYEVIDEMK
jgi:hypothetical protein